MCSIYKNELWKYENDDVDINGLFEVKGFYINGDHRKDRKQHIEHQLEQLRITDNITRFNAIKNTNGRIGCSLSHLKCLQMAKEANWECVMILEDDILFMLPNDFVENVNSFFSNKVVLRILSTPSPPTLKTLFGSSPILNTLSRYSRVATKW